MGYYEDQINELNSRILTLEEDLNRPRETQIPVRILDRPTAETQSAGFSSRSGYYLFRFRIEGPATEFIGPSTYLAPVIDISW